MGGPRRRDGERGDFRADGRRSKLLPQVALPRGFAEYDYVGISKVPEGGTEESPPASDPDRVV
ncbi:MAG: hypothetical protein AVDCRST_MAG02-1158 [uncultured Rubrobacteraceae bacterium]|uniref:Uncharacterized protein n=1 Tax=uncultured Rubrobacteraceae bacterium TaxID=349277 RepID=A0A6J4R030_9ACTN|nr:MAG: hypothetical protein AVDCRST_MAG02-1158 [uncultured Rubrobacteraceae bacterium]